MKHMVVMYEIGDNETLEDMLPRFPLAKSISLTPGFKIEHLATGEEVVIPYACWFNAESSNNFLTHVGDAEYNWLFLRTQQNWANDMLRARGHLLLNDVYDILGMSRTAMGAVVGWIYTKHEEADPSQHTFVNFVNFGCWEQEGAVTREGGAILLDFNVQGPILHALR